MGVSKVQDNLEKLKYVKGNLAPLQKRLTEMEEELKSLNQMLSKA